MKKLFFLFLFLLFLSCKNNQKKEASIDSKDILSNEKMVSILVDIHLIEAELFIMQNNGKDTKYYTSWYYKYLTQKYNISFEQFKININYYSSHVKEFEKIYEQVLNNISQKNGEIYKK